MNHEVILCSLAHSLLKYSRNTWSNASTWQITRIFQINLESSGIFQPLCFCLEFSSPCSVVTGILQSMIRYWNFPEGLKDSKYYSSISSIQILLRDSTYPWSTVHVAFMDSQKYWNIPNTRDGIPHAFLEIPRSTGIFQIRVRFHISMITCPCCFNGIPHAFLEIPRSTGIFQIRVLEYSSYAYDSSQELCFHAHLVSKVVPKSQVFGMENHRKDWHKWPGHCAL